MHVSALIIKKSFVKISISKSFMEVNVTAIISYASPDTYLKLGG